MEDPRPEKVAVVTEVRERLSQADAVVLTEYRGLDVPSMAELRRSLAEAGATYKVYKNTLVRLAARELDLDIDDLLTGPTAMAFAMADGDGGRGDAVSLAKALRVFADDNEALVIKGGLLGAKLLSPTEIVALSKLAPREELLARFAGGLAAPMQQFAALLGAVPRKFAYALQALIESGGAPGAPAADAATEADEATPDEGAAAEGGDDTADGAPEAGRSAGGGDDTADGAPEAGRSAGGGDDTADGAPEAGRSAGGGDDTDENEEQES